MIDCSFMKITFTSLVEKLSGKLNGNCIQEGKFGSIIRKNPVPHGFNPGTVSSQRSVISFASRSWKLAGCEFKSDWGTLANTGYFGYYGGTVLPLDGLQAFIKVCTAINNINRSGLGFEFDFPATTPATGTPTFLKTFNVTGSVPGNVITIEDNSEQEFQENDFLLLYCSKPFGCFYQNPGFSLNFCGSVRFNTHETHFIDMTLYNEHYPNLPDHFFVLSKAFIFNTQYLNFSNELTFKIEFS